MPERLLDFIGHVRPNVSPHARRNFASAAVLIGIGKEAFADVLKALASPLVGIRRFSRHQNHEEHGRHGKVFVAFGAKELVEAPALNFWCGEVDLANRAREVLDLIAVAVNQIDFGRRNDLDVAQIDVAQNDVPVMKELDFFKNGYAQLHEIRFFPTGKTFFQERSNH